MQKASCNVLFLMLAISVGAIAVGNKWMTSLNGLLLIPSLSMGIQGGTVTLSWPSLTGYSYQPFWSDNLLTWHKRTPAAIAGNGSVLATTGAQMPVRCFYRIAVVPTP